MRCREHFWLRLPESGQVFCWQGNRAADKQTDKAAGSLPSLDLITVFSQACKNFLRNRRLSCRKKSCIIIGKLLSS